MISKPWLQVLQLPCWKSPFFFTIAVDRIKKYAYWPEAAATLTFNYNLWPIPQTVIDTNKDQKLDQNPGWTR